MGFPPRILSGTQLLEPYCRSGFRVLRYDLFGRELLDRLHIVYTRELFNRQLSDLLDALEVKKVSPFMQSEKLIEMIPQIDFHPVEGSWT